MNNLSKCINIIIILSLFSLLLCTTASKRNTGKNNPYRGQAEGWAKIYDDDVALARDRAIDDAKLKLVEKILGTQIMGKNVMENYRIVKSIVEAKSIGLVKDDKIIKEGRLDELYKVTLEGTVLPSAVEDAIDDILRRYGRPKFMVIIDENFEGNKHKPGFTETEILLQEIMGNSGFTFVDSETAKRLMKNNRAKITGVLQGRINDDMKKLLMDSVGAEVIISGEVQTKDQSAALRQYSKNMKSKSAIVKLKAIDLYTGTILATMSKNAPGLHIEDDTASKKAVENALKKIIGHDDQSGKFIMGPFLNAIVTKFIISANNRQINVMLTGLKVNDVDRFRNQIKQRIRGVKAVEIKGQYRKASTIEVYFSGRTEEFSYELSKKADKLGYQIEIVERYPNRIVLKVKKLK